MADTETNNGQEPQVDEKTASAQNAQEGANEKPVGNEPTEPVSSAPEGSDELPDWARKQLKKARDEAASYRVQLREVEEKFKGAKTDAELEEQLKPLQEKLTAQAEANAELERQLIIRDYGLDKDLAEFVTGENAEEWETKAKALSERLGASNSEKRFGPGRPPAGRFGNEQRVEADPKKTAQSVYSRYRD